MGVPVLPVRAEFSAGIRLCGRPAANSPRNMSKWRRPGTRSALGSLGQRRRALHPNAAFLFRIRRRPAARLALGGLGQRRRRRAAADVASTPGVFGLFGPRWRGRLVGVFGSPVSAFYRGSNMRRESPPAFFSRRPRAMASPGTPKAALGKRGREANGDPVVRG